MHGQCQLYPRTWMFLQAVDYGPAMGGARSGPGGTTAAATGWRPGWYPRVVQIRFPGGAADYGGPRRTASGYPGG